MAATTVAQSNERENKHTYLGGIQLIYLLLETFVTVKITFYNSQNNNLVYCIC